MYGLLIVDDEDIAIKGLCDFVDWNSLGYYVVSTAYTIDEAMDAVERGNIDVVLTDIELEGESGLDLVGILRENYPEIHCVILTGHEKFEYARSALRYDTFDFLTKPVQFDALRHTFISLAQQLNKQRNDMIMKDEYLHFRRAAFFNRIVKEKGVYDEKEASDLSIVTKGCMLLVRIRVENPSYDAESAKAMKDSLVSAVLSKIPQAIDTQLSDNNMNEYTYLVDNIDEESLIENLFLMCQDLLFPLHIGVSRYFYQIQDLVTAYCEAGKALDYCVLQHQDKHVVLYCEIQGMQSEDVISEVVAMQINDALCSKDVKTLENVTRQEMVQMYKGTGSINYLYSFCIEFHIIVDRFLRQYLIGYEGGHILDSIRNIVLCSDLNALLKYNREYVFQLKSQLDQTTPYANDTVCQIQTYINEHYSENISLQTLAEQFFLHPNYLSRLFQEKSGHNFIDYLTQVRVEKSKRLLSDTGFSMYDISQMVGYSTPNYFSKVFKISTGMTPKQYRDKNRKEHDSGVK